MEWPQDCDYLKMWRWCMSFAWYNYGKVQWDEIDYFLYMQEVRILTTILQITTISSCFTIWNLICVDVWTCQMNCKHSMVRISTNWSLVVFTNEKSTISAFSLFSMKCRSIFTCLIWSWPQCLYIQPQH